MCACAPVVVSVVWMEAGASRRSPALSALRADRILPAVRHSAADCSPAPSLRCSLPGGTHTPTMVFISVFAILALLGSAEASVGLSTNNSFCTESKECLEYELVCKTDEYEVRHYSPTRWVSTDAEAYFMGVGAAMAFRRLFQYITGANEGGIQMEMTAPVLVKIPEATKMWEPAIYTLNFPLPAAYQDKPPTPTNEKLYFTEMPEMDVYVRSYGGWMLSVTSRLHAHLLTKELERVGAAYNRSYHYGVGYDSPLKLLNRHNEVWYVAEGEPVCTDPREPTPAHTPRPTPTGLPAVTQSDIQSDAPADSQSDSQTDPQTDAQTVSQSDSQTDPQTDSQTVSQPNSQTDPKTDSPTVSQSDSQSDSETDVEADSVVEFLADSPSEPLPLTLSDSPSVPSSDLSSYATANCTSTSTSTSASQPPPDTPAPSATTDAATSPSSGLPTDSASGVPPTSTHIPQEPTTNSSEPATASPSLEPQSVASQWNSTAPHSSADTPTDSSPAAQPDDAHQ